MLKKILQFIKRYLNRQCTKCGTKLIEYGYYGYTRCPKCNKRL